MIPQMDLSRQYIKIEKEIGQAIGSVLRKTAFIGGPFVEAFEKEFAKYVGTKYVAGVSNGTDALFLACKALGIGPGDEVIVPANTFIATAWGPIHAGAEVVFCDCDKETWEIDPVSAKKQITDKTKAIIGVHLYGQPFDIGGIQKIVEENNLSLIEDCAQAHGATYSGQNVGTFGVLSTFSFYPGKNLGAYGDAGAIATNNEGMDKKIRAFRNQGSYEKYRHEELGYNMRLDGVQAAILSVKLKYLREWTERRQCIANRYDMEISNARIVKQKRERSSESVYHLYVVCVDNRKEFMDYMVENGVNCGIHYPVPCHIQNAIKDKYVGQRFPVSEDLANRCVSLPMFPELTDEEIGGVINLCNSY